MSSSSVDKSIYDSFKHLQEVNNTSEDELAKMVDDFAKEIVDVPDSQVKILYSKQRACIDLYNELIAAREAMIITTNIN